MSLVVCLVVIPNNEITRSKVLKSVVLCICSSVRYNVFSQRAEDLLMECQVVLTGGQKPGGIYNPEVSIYEDPLTPTKR